MKIIIAGGGTGGHIYPGVSLAQEFKNKNTDNEILFIGTKVGLEAKVVERYGFPIKFIEVSGLIGKGFVSRIKGLLKIPGSLYYSYKIIRGFSPNLIIGVGGYASGPLVLTGALMGVSTVIIEQNSVPGITNRILGVFVAKIFTAFSITADYFSRRKVVLTGNPVRNYLARQFNKKRDKGFCILVIGGSLGAHKINISIIDAIDLLRDYKEDIKFIHQTGGRDFTDVSKGYTNRGWKADVVPFIEDMAKAYSEADIVISRAGATTVAELAVCGKSAILIPYPYAYKDHQRLNALEFFNKGAVSMVLDNDVNGRMLADKILEFYNNREKIKEMEQRISLLAKPDAGKRIVEECYRLVESRS